MENESVIEIKDIRFRSRRFQAPAKRLDEDRLVFVLDVPPNPIACWLSSWVPQLVHSWLLQLLPEWFLPTTVVMKERNPAKADSYETKSKHIGIFDLSRRRHQIRTRPTPAILLEKVERVSLHSLSTQELKSPFLLTELQGMYNLLTKNGVVHGDPRLHNFLRIDKRIVAIDFEFSYPLPSDVTNKDELETLKIEFGKRVRQEVGVELDDIGPSQAGREERGARREQEAIEKLRREEERAEKERLDKKDLDTDIMEMKREIKEKKRDIVELKHQVKEKEK
ncbi:hypothetical protein B0H66DRAFT_587711 [Apodospora peruviana]|uniref:Protein kinase domain-containing protein n=1 Tax=Apodospora peruviana TaxID=516989 RepID=A0AAE0IUH6_9PEZI|nr:hypothetical protein B0H66DRAFT_587711 [Apodospora peruviana]